MLRSYVRLALFALGLLIGIQVPGFVADYGQRVEAHRLESQHSLQGFQDTAGRFFSGDLDQLVAHYRTSEDPVIRSDADSVAALVARRHLLDREWEAMHGAWYTRVLHVLLRSDRQLFHETLDGYRYQVLLEPGAIAWGIGCALIFALVAEFLYLLVTAPFHHPGKTRWS